ncbi:ribosome recycling factor [candidate division FCPU426 bacterium]|nr:ribosome recycling factor [candidate division FCPU426 bacterium]
MTENTPDAIQKETQSRMSRAIEALRREFSTVRTGRASSAILDSVRVEYYGSPMPVNQVASIATPDAKTLEIKPWDASILGEIEKAILKANLGITPMNDGKLIRLAFPQLTEERRKELVKHVHKMAEDAKVEIRGHRRKSMEMLKELRKGKALSEDNEKAAEEKIQKLTDEFIAQVDDVTKHKEHELMEI